MPIHWNNTHAPKPKLVLGQRTRHEIILRINELEHRLKPTVYDHAEIARLRDLLKSAGGQQPC